MKLNEIASHAPKLVTMSKEYTQDIPDHKSPMVYNDEKNAVSSASRVNADYIKTKTGSFVLVVKQKNAVTEGTGLDQELGIVVVRDKETNEFEDIHVVDFKTQDYIKGGHAANLEKSFTNYLREHQLFEHVEEMLKKHLKATPLGADFGDTENFDITMFGPITTTQFGNIKELF